MNPIRVAQLATGRHRYHADTLIFAHLAQIEVPALCGEWGNPRPTTAVLSAACSWCVWAGDASD